MYRKERRKDSMCDTSELVSAVLNLDFGTGLKQNLKHQIDIHEHILQNDLNQIETISNIYTKQNYNPKLIIQTSFTNYED